MNNKITRAVNKSMLSLLLLGSIAASTITVNVNASFWDECVTAAKDKTPLLEKGWEMIKKEGHKIKKYLPRGVREVFIGALATMIGKYIFTVLVKTPLEAAKNKLNETKKLLYITKAQSLLKNENFLEDICEKALKLGLPLTTSEQIAMVALYLMDDQELTTQQLMAEETIDKIVSGEVTIDKKQLKKLIQSIIKQTAGNDKDEDSDEDKENAAIDKEDGQVAAKDKKADTAKKVENNTEKVEPTPATAS